jgi:hypothetical protein
MNKNCRIVPADPVRANFSREPPFLLRGLSYMRELPPECADRPQERIGGVNGGGGSVNPKIAIWHVIEASADGHFNRGVAW